MYCLFFSFFFVYRLLNKIYVSTWPWIQWPHLIHLLNLIFLNFDLDFLGTKVKLFENNDYFISSISIQILSLSFVCLMTLVRTSSIVCNFLSCNIFVRFWNRYTGLRKKRNLSCFFKKIFFGSVLDWWYYFLKYCFKSPVTTYRFALSLVKEFVCLFV